MRNIHRFLVSDFHNPINKLSAFIASGDADTQNNRVKENPMACFLSVTSLLLSTLHLTHILIGDIVVTIKIKSCRLVVELGACATLIEEF